MSVCTTVPCQIESFNLPINFLVLAAEHILRKLMALRVAQNVVVVSGYQ